MRKIIAVKQSSWWLGLIVLVELLAQTYLPAYGSKDLAAVLYLAAGLAVGLLPLFSKQLAAVSPASLPKPLAWLLFTLLVAATTYFGWQAIQAQVLDHTFADMLPIIKIMGERWLAGEEVYAIIPEIWDGMQPIYLPVMWLAYVPALVLDLDMRVMNLVFMLGVALLVLQPWRVQTLASYLLRLLLLLVLFSYIFYTYTTFITISEEPVVVAAYACLAFSLRRKKVALFIIALASCLLSRYALIFWAAAYLLYELVVGERREALIKGFGTLLLMLVLLVISQGIFELELFYSLKDAYLDSFQNPDLLWRTQNTVSKNIGMARFLPFEYLLSLHQLMFWGSLVLPFLLFGWYHFGLRQKGIALWLFALCSLKLCLVFFFNFNALPYSYLFYTSTTVSLVLFSEWILNKKGTSYRKEKAAPRQ